MTTLPKYHWKKDKLDKRDFKFTAKAVKLPGTVDLRAYCSAIEDQGSLGSCTGQAIAGIMEYFSRKARKNTDVSRLFIYYQERLLIGSVNYDSGAYLRDGIKVINKFGAPLEALWPYIENRFAIKPSKEAYKNALTRRAVSYQRCADIAAIKTALSKGLPVTAGFLVYESFESNAVYETGIMPYPDVRNEELLGGHAVALVGYNDQTQTFIARNSWGANWGDHGYFYMPYRVIQDPEMSSDFWTILGLTST